MPLLSTFGAASARGFGNLSGIEIPVDNLFNTVSFLSHFDGTNNGVNNVFDDSSSSNHTITPSGQVTQGSFGPFARSDGEWGVAFPRPNLDNQNIYAAYNNADTAFGTGDFTVELFAFISVVPGSGDYANVFDFRTGGNTNHIDLYFGDTSKRLIYFAGGNTVFTSSTDLPIGEWVHLALVRSSGTTTLYQNGVSVGSASNTTNFSAAIFRFGSRYTDNFGMTGSISNARVVKGDAVYTSSFTPTTSPLTAITNTVFLSAQSNRFVDNSASAHTVGGVNSPSVSAFGPFLTSSVYDAGVNGASAYFDGSDKLSSSASTDYEFGTGDLTVEYWAYPTASGAIQNILDNRAEASGWKVGRNASNQFQVYNEVTSSYLFESGTFPENAWSHFCWTRASGVNKFFINGVQSGGNVSDSSNFNSNSLNIGVQHGGTTQYFTGYITCCRVIKGTAVEPSGVPSAPPTAVTNTKLLLNMADGQAIDSAAQNNLTLFGNAKISNAQSKFGGTSLDLDGTGDYVRFPELNGPLDGAGENSPLTIEGWFYWDGTQYSGGFNTVIGINRLSDGNNTMLLYCGDSGGGDHLGLRYNGSSEQILSDPIATNTWHHFAMVLNNGSYKFQVFLNGTSVFTSATTINVAPSDCSFLIGAEADAASAGNLGDYFSGYIDDIRISKVARYTSNFTPPTAAFADKGQ